MSTSTLELGKEYPPEGEEEVMEMLMQGIQASMQKRSPPTPRDQHPKSHGYVKAEFIVDNNLADDLRVGVFKEPKTHEAWIRFSNGHGGAAGRGQADHIPDLRGMAIKVIGVAGEQVQDFILMSSPFFFLKDLEAYILFLTMVGAIQKGEIKFNPPPDPPTIAEHLREQFGKIAYAFKLAEKMKKDTPSPLEIRYWSSTPYRFGERDAIRFSVIPQLNRKSFRPADRSDNYLRETMVTHLATQDAYFDFMIQFQIDPEKMPIEDPTVEWDEQFSPFIKVATIRIPKQEFNTAERNQQDEQQSFSPWYTLDEHKPLGGVNRGRKMYADLATMRNKMNQERDGG
jgi:catalase